MFSHEPWTIDRIFRFILVIIAIVAGFWLLATLSDVLLPFAVAFLLAYILNPFVNRIQKRVKSRGVAVAIAITLAVIASLGLGFLAFQPIQSQFAHAAQLFTKAVTDAKFSAIAEQWLPPDFWQSLRQHMGNGQWLASLQSKTFWTVLGSLASKLAPGALAIVSGTFELITWVFGITMVGIYLFFMLLEFSGLQKTISAIVPATKREALKEFLAEADSTMSSYFRAQGLIALLLSVVFTIGFSLIGLPMGILFGIITGFSTMIPYLQIATVPFALLLCLLQSMDQGASFWHLSLLVLSLYLICQVLQDFVLVPRLVGKASGLSPVMIILALSVWGKLLGVLGLILAIPLTCLAVAYYRRLVVKLGSASEP